MSRILRETVPVDGQAHHFEINGDVLHVDSRQIDVVEFWWAETSGPKTKREFTVVGTGHPYPDHWRYVGTTIAPGGALVWHLMQVP